MINKTLDLPFDEPPETYSTSEHLYHDLGIAPGTKGRLKEPAPRPPREPRERSAGDRPPSNRPRAERPPRDRTRRRLRNGEPISADAGTAEASNQPEAQSEARTDESGQAPRRRRRRRSGNRSAVPSAE